MKNNNIPLIAATTILIIIVFYLANFLPIFGTQLSGDTAVWGQFGDYIGGTLNPVLSFASVVLLIRSLTLQNEANDALKKELKNNEITENFRSFSVLFFSMIESQRSLYQEFRITSDHGTTQAVFISGAAAVNFIEEKIEELRDSDASDTRIAEFLEDLDSEDRLFGILRAFYITVKTVCEKLDKNKGFELDLAKEQIITLINFTDFSQLRLIVIGAQFLNYKSCQYLKANDLFITALKEVNLTLDLY
jgi:hypothetical protein